MNRILIAGALALSAAGQALAADLPPAPAPRAPAAYVPVSQPVYNWSGFYIGGNGGYGFAKGDVTGTAVGPFGTVTSTASGDLNGGLAGGQVGFNWQTGALVLGAEGDFQWTWQQLDTTVGCGIGCTTTESHKINWFATARGRIGAAIDRVLVYGTGGVAWINATSSLTATVGGITATFAELSNTATGWTAGAGAEFALTENISAKVEYLYINIDNFSATGPIPAAIGGGTITETAQIRNNVIRAGLNLRFPVR